MQRQSARSTLDRPEGYVSSGQWRYVREFVRTDGELFVGPCYDAAARTSVRLLARSRVELIRLERTAVAGLFVNGKRLWGRKGVEVRYREQSTFIRSLLMTRIRQHRPSP